jgi:hypothetical protein
MFQVEKKVGLEKNSFMKGGAPTFQDIRLLKANLSPRRTKGVVALSLPFCFAIHRFRNIWVLKTPTDSNRKISNFGGAPTLA